MKTYLLSSLLVLATSGCTILGGFFGAECGNGLIEETESCDDGNSLNSDGCDAFCQSEGLCGNGLIEETESCDDGNVTNSDGCSSTCQLESGLCGNGIVESDEECDDGNVIDGDGCSSICQLEGISTIVQVSSGSLHTCAVTDLGDIKCWGNNASGELGYGDTFTIGDNETPALVGFIDLGVGVSNEQLSTGGAHSCAVSANSAVRCWGNNSSGQLGLSNTSNLGDNEFPASAGVIGLNNTAKTISTGGAHTCALLNNGGVQCWGAAGAGQLGYGNPINIGDDESINSVGLVNLNGATVAQLATGVAHTCVLLDNGAIRCWGDNSSGQLGYGNTFNLGDGPAEDIHITDVPIPETAIAIAANGNTTCAILLNGQLRCWGENSSGQLGQGNINDLGDNESVDSVPPISLNQSIAQVALGISHTCVAFTDGGAVCWGSNNAGQLGQGNTIPLGDTELASSISAIDVGGAVAQITAGDSFTCALLLSGAVRCWGDGSLGRLGYGNLLNVGDDESPAGVGDVPLF